MTKTKILNITKNNFYKYITVSPSITFLCDDLRGILHKQLNNLNCKYEFLYKKIYVSFNVKWSNKADLMPQVGWLARATAAAAPGLTHSSTTC